MDGGCSLHLQTTDDVQLNDMETVIRFQIGHEKFEVKLEWQSQYRHLFQNGHSTLQSHQLIS